jgi:3',5'-cyclic AMP phosphodiesterase CpdA
VRVQGLGSAPPWRWKSGRVTRRQADLLVASLAGAPPDALRVVALHHPLSQRKLATLIGRTRLLAGLARARVDLVLAGHTHLPTAERADAGGGHAFVEIVAGTATSTRTRGAGRSWTLIRAEPEWITVEHRRHDDAGWHGGPRTRFRRSPRPA